MFLLLVCTDPDFQSWSRRVVTNKQTLQYLTAFFPPISFIHGSDLYTESHTPTLIILWCPSCACGIDRSASVMSREVTIHKRIDSNHFRWIDTHFKKQINMKILLYLFYLIQHCIIVKVYTWIHTNEYSLVPILWVWDASSGVVACCTI